jgi:protein involved in polysaccharide export with SLBB domain
MPRFFFALLIAATLVLAGCAADQAQSPADLDTIARAGSYEVHGAVRHPGTFNLRPGEVLTLGQAIRRAGGALPGNTWYSPGDLSAVRLQRLVSGSTVQYTLDAREGHQEEEFPVRAGDWIKVPQIPF